MLFHVCVCVNMNCKELGKQLSQNKNNGQDMGISHRKGNENVIDSKIN